MREVVIETGAVLLEMLFSNRRFSGGLDRADCKSCASGIGQ